ncbi:hypothetical protein, partial [Streptacidiphilus neutrinimicus]|uniref:hypothetical protein n=1 Tax=Streptacidiphilus neutrinimicus TaxID=105420 RepID=UPI0005A8DD07
MPIDFFAHEALPAPQVGAEQARRIAAGLGLDGPVEELGSQQDANFLVRGENGAAVAVLKIANPAFG